MSRAHDSRLDTVIELIARRCDEQGRWSVSCSELRDCLGVDRMDFYRDLYAAATAERAVLEVGDITGSFSHEGPEVLLAALEVFCATAAEERLAQAGVFLPHESHVDLIETFIATAAETLAGHAYDEAEFSAMLRAFRGFEAAAAAYLKAHFPLDRLIEKAVDAHCRGRRYDIAGLARINARRLIGLYMRRHILSERALFAGLLERMRRQAVAQGYVREEARAGGSAVEQPDGLEAASRTLGVAGLPLSRRMLRDRYRGLMKRFHPDVNPAGLERAKEINAAYSRLLAALS